MQGTTFGLIIGITGCLHERTRTSACDLPLASSYPNETPVHPSDMPTILQLPYEILLRIASIYLEEIPRKPLNLILVDSIFRDVGQCILHENLRFHSRSQMKMFHNTTRLGYIPRTLSIELAGGASDRTIFESLLALLRHIIAVAPKRLGSLEDSRRLVLQRAKLRLNSYMLDLNPGYIYQALALLE